MATKVVDAAGVSDLGESDFFTELIPIGERINVPMDNHWNELGHKLFAEAVSARILESGVLESKAKSWNAFGSRAVHLPNRR